MAAPVAAADRSEQLVLDPVLILDRRFRPSERAAERNQVAAIGGAEGAAGKSEVERLEQVRLAGPVRSNDADDPQWKLDLDAVEAAQRLCLDRSDEDLPGQAGGG